MPIQFACPNGHQLAAPRKQAGKPGRCPTCDVPYVTPRDIGDPTAICADDVDVTPATSSNDDVDANGKEKDAVEESFQFLCPTGHKINAPARLAGEAGECPRCGEQFLIPETGSAGLAAGESVIPLGVAKGVWAVPVAALNGEQAMADVLTWFWQEKGPEQQLEITLRDGSLLRPDFFGQSVSSAEVGVFGEAEQGGGTTLRAIAWDAIAHVAVSNLVNEVDDLFRD